MDSTEQTLARYFSGETTAEEIKLTVGNVHPDTKVERMQVRGRDLVTGVPKIVGIDSNEVRDFITEQVKTIVETVKIALEQTPPELSADIVDRGLVITGGGALLKNLDRLLQQETGIPVTVPEDPLAAVVLGSGKVLDNPDILREVTS